MSRRVFFPVIVSLAIMVAMIPLAPSAFAISDNEVAVAAKGGAGNLDPAFSRDGRAFVGLASETGAERVLLRPDGSMVVVGTLDSPSPAIAMAAIERSGHPDLTFGNQGAIAWGSSYGNVEGWDAALQPDGKIVVVGNAWINYRAILVARFMPNGARDLAFGDGGEMLVDIADRFDRGKAVAIQSDGKIVVAGETEDTSHTYRDLMLARLRSEGSLDPTFGSNGIVRISFLDKTTVGGLDIQGDGKLVIAGRSETPVESWTWLSRFTHDGVIDETFGQSGSVLTESGFWYDVEVLPEGKIITSGSILLKFSLARFLDDGSPDSAFGTGGFVNDDLPGTADDANDVAVDAHGNLVVVGSTEIGIGSSDPTMSVVARYVSNGTPDSSFGIAGKAYKEADKTYPYAAGANSVAIQPDGRILAAGFVGTYFLILRYVVCTIQGSPLGDVLTGTSRGDVVCAGAGNDTINGGGGPDIIFGQTGDDTISGGEGSDFVFGNDGSDTVVGDAGNDVLSGGSSGDRLEGGAGRDTADYLPSPASVTVSLAPSPPTASGGDATGDSFFSIEGLAGSVYNDVLTGSARTNVLDGRTGADALDGQGGLDFVDYASSDFGVILDLRTPGPQVFSFDRLANIESVVGSDLSDRITGNGVPNGFGGGVGADELYGLGGDDYLYGGFGDDRLDGGNGVDTCDASIGTDIVVSCEQ